MIAHALYFGCYFLGVLNHSSQLILVILVIAKETPCFSIFLGYFYFQENSFYKVKRTFWTLVLLFFDQSFIMTIIEVILAPFVIKCIGKPIEYTWCLLKAPKNRLTYITNTVKKPNAKHLYNNLFKLVTTVYTNFQIIKSFSNSVIIITLQIFSFCHNFYL